MDENILQLLNKENIKPRTIIDYTTTTANYQPNKPGIKRTVTAEPCIKSYYIKQTNQPSVNADAYLE